MTTRHKQTAPRLRFQGFDGEWEEKKIIDVADYVDYRGKTPRKTEEGIFLITAKNVKMGYLDYQVSQEFIAVEDFENVMSRGKAEIGDVLITTEAPLGNVAQIDYENVALAQRVIKYRGIRNVLNNDFLAQKFLTDEFQVILNSLSSGGTVQGIKGSLLHQIEISFPTFPEQTQLGNFFRQLDHRIAQSRALWEKSRQLKKAMLAKMFPAVGETIPKIRFKGFTGEWERKTLGEVGNTFGGLTNKSREDFGHGEARYITYMNVYQNPISSLDQLDSIEIDEKQNEVKKGDVLFTTSSETPEEVGMSSVWTFEKENVYLNSFCFGYRLNEKIDLNYLAYCLRSDCVRSQMILLAQGISRYNISKKGVMEIEILIPSPEEQTAIGNFFRQLDDTIALHALETEKLGYLKKALLAAMLV